MTPDVPERALERAREQAAVARGAGEYAEADQFAALDNAPADDPLKLHTWAFLEVDRSQIYSTRRFGAPITLLKRGLLRLLDQYHGQLIAQQTRFNLHLLGAVMDLQDRVARLEQRSAEGEERR